ncbi:hypothetical protein GCM10025860_16650 [Methanobacterium ferruginis]|nr:hypothetical protein GCM10025860_16650 [Methanobacterium ferruginis]
MDVICITTKIEQVNKVKEIYGGIYNVKTKIELVINVKTNKLDIWRLKPK